MSFTLEHGRTGNSIIRNLAISLIARKFNLKVIYCQQDVFDQLGIDLFSGSHVYPQTEVITDDNYFSYYHSSSLHSNIIARDFYQLKKVIDLIYDYLHSIAVKEKIIKKNPFRNRYDNNNDLFIHIRLGDVPHFNPGVDYYLEMIKKIHFDKLDIATDSPNDPMVQRILEEYPKAFLYLEDEITTFQFASTAKHIVLSNGTFSAIIGYLAYYSTVYYPEPRVQWHGDIFSIPSWIRCEFN